MEDKTMDCPHCSKEMFHVITASPNFAGGLSNKIYWCKEDGVLVEKEDWTSNPDNVYIPKTIEAKNHDTTNHQ